MTPTDENRASVGRQLAARRDALDLTQAQLAQRIGIAAPTVTVTERGRTAISRANRARWEKALGLTPGTITRAYRDGTPIEVAAKANPKPYANPRDPYESAIEALDIDEEAKRTVIDILREARSDPQTA